MRNNGGGGVLKTSGVEGSSMRSQLLWASLFPLAFFGLLSMLVTASALNQMVSNLVAQRNTAQVQLAAAILANKNPPTSQELNMALQLLDPVSGSQLYLVDASGNLILSSLVPEAGTPARLPLPPDELAALIQSHQPVSRLVESGVTADEVMVSFAPLPGQPQAVILVEPWAASMSPAFYYQVVLVALLALGTTLSLGMLSLSLGRIISPIADLAENARGAVPGSVFHPVLEQGPGELRILIRAFNQMVIRLAEQQGVLREYAHKALLSQEEERQRLSHELHDGTVQDLVGLAQRVELCRGEMERNPLQARRRLDELQDLVQTTLSDVRRISTALRPPVLDDLGLSVALDALCKDLEQDKPALLVEYSVAGDARRLPPDLELAVYRIVQEALANIRKHVQAASQVQVDLVFAEHELQAQVRNNGGMFSNPDMNTLVRSGHLGLAGMYERARLFGGNLTITSDPDGNTLVALNLPYLLE